MKSKKISKTTSKRQINKLKRAQAKLKAKASERRRRRIARNSINIPSKFKFKHLTKRVNHNGGFTRWYQLPKVTPNFKRGYLCIFAKTNMYRGEFKVKMMIKLSTRLRRRMEFIKKQLSKRLKFTFDRRHGKGYQRCVRARVTYSERALGLRLGKGKGKLGGWRIPIKANKVLYRVMNLSPHGQNNIIKRSNGQLGQNLVVGGYNVYG